MALAWTSTTEPTEPGYPGATVHRLPARLPARDRRAGLAALALSLAGWGTWFGWRVTAWSLHPLPAAILLLEVAGVAIGAFVAVALVARGSVPAEAASPDVRRFADAVAAAGGRAPSDDLRRDVGSVARGAVRAIVRRPARRRLADVAVAAVVVDGPRRLAIVALATLGLLIGTAPFPWPPAFAVAGAGVGIASMALAHRLSSGGRIRFGDRTRWAYSSFGQVVVPRELDGVAPRDWLGTVATVVLVNVAVALRGMSDRWTHGLPAMADGERVVAMAFALCLVLGALYTMVTTDAPDLDASAMPRRLDERSARQSVLGLTVCAGLIGFIAGVLPGRVDPADHDSGGVEQVTDDDPVVTPADFGDRLDAGLRWRDDG
jgi:hypothetical protein